MNRLQILLASNMNAVENMAEACRRLQLIFPTSIQFSDAVSSMAINKAGELVPEGGSYLNVLCLAETNLPLEEVQSVLKHIEKKMGRTKGSEVVIDLDLVVWNGEILRPWDAAQAFYKECLANVQRINL